MATKADLESKLVELGVDQKDFEGKTNLELQQMIELKTPAQTPEEMEALKNQSLEAEKKLGKPQAPKMYTQEEVKAMFAELTKDFVKKDSKDSDEEEDGPRKHTIRLSRINNKFIIGMKNLNKDPYFPDKVVYSEDIFNSDTKQHVPHVTLILEEDEKKPGVENTLTIPLETALKVSSVVTCELVERKGKDASEKYGNIEVKEMKENDWGEKGTGNFVQGKAKITKETYIVRLPDGKVVEVIPDVVNWKNTSRK